MLTAYFVDDDFLTISELKTIINWNDYNFEVVGYNTDPFLAKQEIKEKKPSLVISDVQMDGLNGLELAESLKESNPHTIFIYLSAYDKFDYAVEAIRLGAIRYIKKPLKKEQLISVLEEISQKSQNDFNDRIYNHLINHDDDLKDLFDSNSFLPKDKSFHIITLNGKNHAKVLDDLKGICSFYCFYEDENYASIIAFDLKDFASFIAHYDDVSSGASPELNDYSHIDKYIRLTRIASKQKFLNGITMHTEVKEDDSYLKICEQFKECKRIFDLQQLIANLKNALIENKINVYYLQNIYRTIVYCLVRFNLVDEDIYNISVLDEYDNIDDLISDLLNYFAQNDNDDFNEKIVNEVKNELINNIDKKIPLSYFAEKYGYNISYFSQLFKKLVKTSFAEYFILLKMDKAKSLIINSNMSLQSIAEAVGYDDYYHFSKMFKKYAQYSPKEFRNLYQKK